MSAVPLTVRGVPSFEGTCRLKASTGTTDGMPQAATTKGSSVDAAGAAKLRWRIEQQQHWRQAEAVLDGRQPSVDPDMEELVSVGDGIRIYAERDTSDGRLRLCKRLIEGVWEHGTLDPAFDDAGTHAREISEQVARVA
jgi:hypothetical protein